MSGIEQKVNRHINLTFIEFAVEWEENYRPQRESVLDLYGRYQNVNSTETSEGRDGAPGELRL